MLDSPKRAKKNRKTTLLPIHENLRENAESDALFLSIGEGAIVTDERGHVSRINEVALNILGFRENEILGKWYPSIVIAEDRSGNVIPNMERAITEVFLIGKALFRKVYYRRKDGSRVPVAVTVAPVMVNGNPVGAIEVFRDITEEVELENSKDEFISIASHQLRTPATIVKQYIGMLLEGYHGALTSDQLKMLRTAYENNEHQLETINDLLKVAQADSNTITVVRKQTDLVQLIQEIVNDQQKKYDEKDLILTFEHALAPVMGNVDPLHMRMIVDNLLDNAYKYSRDNTKIMIRLSQSTKFICIVVADHGVGIDKKDMSKLFKKFSRIDNPLSFSGGTGLGLYWVHKLVALHNGTIKATSKLNSGTIFTIKLPKT